jgi:hypothetical protein
VQEVSKFIGDLVVKVITDDAAGLFELVQPLQFQSDIAGRTFTAPVGLRTDFCSTPVVAGFKFDRYRRAGTIHDKIYGSHEVERDIADQVLREMLLIEGAPEAEADAFFEAVRLFGGSHW